MNTLENNIDYHAIIELIDTKQFYSLPKKYVDIIKQSGIKRNDRVFIYELFFKFLDIYRKNVKSTYLKISVHNLAEEYDCSEETIRRKLIVLEKANLIRKEYLTISNEDIIKTIIVGIHFVLTDSISEDAIRNTKNRNKIVNKIVNKSGVDNKKVAHEQEQVHVQDDKNVVLISDQDQIKELSDLIIITKHQKEYKYTIYNNNLEYIMKRLDKLDYFLGIEERKKIVLQMLYDINAGQWNTTSIQHRLNSILKTIDNNSHKVFV